jgi:hypothetical protein
MGRSTEKIIDGLQKPTWIIGDPAKAFANKLWCPYCKIGELVIKEALKIGAYSIHCSECGSEWVDVDDVFEMK